MSGICIRREALAMELARRGWNASDLARAAALSAATLSAASNGRRISAGTLAKIAMALGRQPVTPGAAELLEIGGT